MNHDHISRPKDVLDTWLEDYDYKGIRKPTTSDNVLVYGLWRERNSEGEYRNKWLILGAASEPSESFKEAFHEVLNRYKVAREQELENETPRLLSLLTVSHGTGRWGVGGEGVGSDNAFAEWSNLTDEQKEIVAEAEPEFVERLLHGEVPCRMVNLITHHGLCAEVTMFHKGEEPHVEVVEQWVDDGESTVPESKGGIDDVLMSAFAFLQLIEVSVVNNAEVGLAGLLQTALGLAREGDGQMVGFLLRIVATGLESGVLNFGED